MNRDFARDWMWSEACEMLARAERLHRELFRPTGLAERLPVWEPPVDIIETDREVLVLVALPGVAPKRSKPLSMAMTCWFAESVSFRLNCVRP